MYYSLVDFHVSIDTSVQVTSSFLIATHVFFCTGTNL